MISTDYNLANYHVRMEDYNTLFNKSEIFTRLSIAVINIMMLYQLIQQRHLTITNLSQNKIDPFFSLILRISLQFLGSFKYQFVASFTESVFK